MAKREALWPYKRQMAFIAIPVVWIGYLIAFALGVHLGAWKGEMAGQTVLIVAIMSVIPLLMVILDFFAMSGAVLDIKGVKIDFGAVQEKRGGEAKGLELPENAGIAGAIITDSAAMNIQRVLLLKEQKIAVANLKDGNAWWMTRLLVLCSGAVRTGTPEIIVFLGTRENVPNIFLGYGLPAGLLRTILQNQKYADRYAGAEKSIQKFHEYKLVNGIIPAPNLPPEAMRYLTNVDYLQLGDEVAEQILLDQLGNVALPGGSLENPPDKIGVGTLGQLFDSCLYRSTIDLDARDEEQVQQLFAARGEYVALVRQGGYISMLKKRDGEEMILRQLALPKEEKN
jgi:hypothetical protein